MAVYLCIGCNQHYCATCDSGEDSCKACSTGPRCVDCAYEHEEEHREQAREENEVFYCGGCGREELTCSKNPCPDVIRDRGES